MKWLRLLFAIITGMAAITFMIDGQMELFFFLGIVCAIAVWSLSWGGKREKG